MYIVVCITVGVVYLTVPLLLYCGSGIFRYICTRTLYINIIFG